VFLAAGCSRFDRAWDQLAMQQPATGIEGAWEGRWIGDNGHAGRLRCILRRADGDTYNAWFHATFWGVFSGEYVVTMTAQSQGDKTLLRGEHDLGWLAGGNYRYDAIVTPERFESRYDSKWEKGRFEMSRPSR